LVFVLFFLPTLDVNPHVGGFLEHDTLPGRNRPSTGALTVLVSYGHFPPRQKNKRRDVPMALSPMDASFSYDYISSTIGVVFSARKKNKGEVTTRPQPDPDIYSINTCFIRACVISASKRKDEALVQGFTFDSLGMCSAGRIFRPTVIIFPLT
jgi:hypothetical protein